MIVARHLSRSPNNEQSVTLFSIMGLEKGRAAWTCWCYPGLGRGGGRARRSGRERVDPSDACLLPWTQAGRGSLACCGRKIRDRKSRWANGSTSSSNVEAHRTVGPGLKIHSAKTIEQNVGITRNKGITTVAHVFGIKKNPPDSSLEGVPGGALENICI